MCDGLLCCVCDGLLCSLGATPWLAGYYGGPFMMMRASSAAGFGGAMGMRAPAFSPVADNVQQESPVERVRSFFPETWLWDFVLMGYY